MRKPTISEGLVSTGLIFFIASMIVELSRPLTFGFSDIVILLLYISLCFTAFGASRRIGELKKQIKKLDEKGGDHGSN